MSTIAMDTAKLIDMLPQNDQEFAYEFVKKLILAWDPDFTKVTPEEAKSIAAAEESGFVPENEIDWDTIGIWKEKITNRRGRHNVCPRADFFVVGFV